MNSLTLGPDHRPGRRRARACLPTYPRAEARTDPGHTTTDVPHVPQCGATETNPPKRLPLRRDSDGRGNERVRVGTRGKGRVEAGARPGVGEVQVKVDREEEGWGECSPDGNSEICNLEVLFITYLLKFNKCLINS